MEQVAGVVKALGEAAKTALPVLKSTTEEAVKLGAPVVSSASKQATEALQGAGVDSVPVLNAAKVRRTENVSGSRPHCATASS